MTNEESDLLNDFAQARIQSHFDRVFAAKLESERKREIEVHDRFHELCEKLSEEDKRTAQDYDTFMFDRISDCELVLFSMILTTLSLFISVSKTLF